MSEASAEAIVTLSPESFAAIMEKPGSEVLVTARIAGVMAARRAPDLIPLCQAAAPADTAVRFEPLGNSNAIRVIAVVTAPEGAQIAAMTAASTAALTIYDQVKDKEIVIDGVRLIASSGGTDAPFRAEGPKEPLHRAARRSEKAPVRPARARPQTLMDEVASPRPSADARREAFRQFMTSRRLRPTTWAKDAGVNMGEILGFLTGRSRGFSGEVAEKLARAAKVKPEDMFR